MNKNIVTMGNNDIVKQTNNESIWKKGDEDLLKEMADKALCFRWLHNESHSKYRLINMCFVIPIIILSTLTGGANYAQDRVPSEHRGTFVIVIGSVNFLAGIIGTIAQYLKVSEINEGHRLSSLSWGKFNRSLKVVLARHPDDRRTPPDELIKSTEEEYSRLAEVSPPIPNEIIKKFMKEIVSKKINEQKLGSKSAKRAEKKKRLELSIPEICGEINATKIYNDGLKPYEDFDSDTPSVVLQKQVHEVNSINQFKNNFKRIHGRNPSDYEINNDVGINNNILTPFMSSSTSRKNDGNVRLRSNYGTPEVNSVEGGLINDFIIPVITPHPQ